MEGVFSEYRKLPNGGDVGVTCHIQLSLKILQTQNVHEICTSRFYPIFQHLSDPHTLAGS